MIDRKKNTKWWFHVSDGMSQNWFCKLKLQGCSTNISDFHNSQYQYDNCIIGQYTQQNWSPITLCGNILLPKTRIQFVWSLFEVHDRLCKTYLVYTCPRIYPLNFWPVMCKSQVFRLRAGSSLPFLRFRTLGGFG